MTQRSAGVNTNYKTYARIRPIDYQSKMVECGADNTIGIRDPSAKGKDKQVFSFSGVFDSTANQETIWAHVAEPCISKVIEGHNSCILSYGQTAGGKSYTIFGEDDSFSVNKSPLSGEIKRDRRGLIPRTVDYIFRKAKEMEDIREFVLTCTITEIFLDQVRDLGKLYSLSQTGSIGARAALNQNSLNLNYENERLAVYENTNGQIVIKDLSQIQIKSSQELNMLLASAFQLRDKYTTKMNKLWDRAHTIFTINVVQKDKENENIPFMNSNIQFVDLAGSERIAKSLTEGFKFEEAILINTSLAALGKCLQNISRSNKSIPYRESQMTRVLQNCMGVSSFVTLIVNLHPSESNYEECYSTLQFAERTKISQNKALQTSQQGGNPAAVQGSSNAEEFVMQNINGYAGNDKLIKSLKDQIKDLETKIDFIQRVMVKKGGIYQENKTKMVEVQNILGLEVDLDKILSRSSQKDLQQFKLQREAMSKLEGVSKTNRELEEEISQLNKHIENIERDEALKQERQSCLIIELRDQVRKLKEQVSANKMQSEEQIRQVKAERLQEITNMTDKSAKLLQEKQKMLMNLPRTLNPNGTNSGHQQSAQAEAQQTATLKNTTKIEVQKELQEQIENLKSEYGRLLETTRTQYEHFLKAKNDEMEASVKAANQFRNKKNQEAEIIRKELVDLYDVVSHQAKIIEKVEIGHYSGEKKKFLIPPKEKPEQPNRTEFQTLFRLLDQRLLKQTSTATNPAAMAMSVSVIGFPNASSNHDNFNNNNQNQSLMQANNSNMNVTFGGTRTETDDKRKIQPTFQSTFVASQTIKSSLVNKLGNTFKKDYKDNFPLASAVDISQMTRIAERDKQIITDICEMTVLDLSKIKTKEEFSQLKSCAELLKESLGAALDRERQLKQQVQMFEGQNDKVDVKALLSERDEFKQLYQQELRKSASMSRGSMFEGTNKKSMVTQASNPSLAATYTQGFYKSPQHYSSAVNLTRPATNPLQNRPPIRFERQLSPIYQ